MVSVNGVCLMPCNLKIWGQAIPCQDYETCSNNFCRPLSCMTDTDCNGFDCNTDTKICTPLKSGLIKISLNAEGTAGIAVAGSPLQWNQNTLAYSTTPRYSPRTNYSILNNRDSTSNMYNPAASWNAAHRCKTCSQNTDLATINSPEQNT